MSENFGLRRPVEAVFPRPQRTVTADDTLTTSDSVVFVNSPSSAVALTLPPNNVQQDLVIKDISGTAETNNITIFPSGSDTIDGESGFVLIINFGSVYLLGTEDGNWLATTEYLPEIPASLIPDETITDAKIAALNKDGANDKVGMRTLGFDPGQAMPGVALLDEIAAPEDNVSLNSNRITNLSDPTDTTDAANKEYVDTAVGAIDLSGFVDLTTNQTIDSFKNIRDHGVNWLQTGDANARVSVESDGTVQWSDGTDAYDVILQRSSAGILEATTGKLQQIADATQQYDLVNKLHLDTALLGYVTLSTSQNISGSKIFTSAPFVQGSSPTDEAIRTFVDSEDTAAFTFDVHGKHRWGNGTDSYDASLYYVDTNVLETGGVLRGLGTPIDSTDFTTKGYVDTAISGIDLSDFVTLDGSDTITGTKTFQSTIIVDGDNSGGLFIQDSNIAMARAVSTDQLIGAVVTGDSANRFGLQTDGKIEWGDGTTPADSFLYRDGAASLHTNSNFTTDFGLFAIALSLDNGGINIINGGTVDFLSNGAGTFLQSARSGDTQKRYKVSEDGIIHWGNGSSATDTLLERSAVNQLHTPGSIHADNGATFANVVQITGGELVLNGGPDLVFAHVPSPSNQIILSDDPSNNVYWQVLADGTLKWADGVGGAYDTQFSRTGAGILSMDASSKWRQSLAPTTGNDLTNKTYVDAKQSGLAAVYKTLADAVATSAAGTAGDYIISRSGVLTAGGITAAVVPLYKINAADYSVSGLTTHMRILSSLATNNTAPGITIKMGLYPITIGTGTATGPNYTIGTVVSGSQVTFTTPAINSAFDGSADFTIPSDGYYTIGVNFSGSQVALSVFDITGSLQIKHA